MGNEKPWVDGPFQLISSSKTGDSIENPVRGTKRLAAEMAIVHNVLLRGVNAVYLQAENVSARGSAQDKLDFANFAYMWGDLIAEHHDTEETAVFPEINRLTGVQGLMDANVDEHKAFHDGVSGYNGYLQKVRNGEEEFDGSKLKEYLDSLMPVLTTHLHNEIDTLLGLEKYEDKCDWAAWFQKVIGDIASKSMKDARYRNEIFPLAIIFHDKTFEGGVWQAFPPIPWIALVALQWLFMKKHKNWWRFSGCDFYSNPKELPFA